MKLINLWFLQHFTIWSVICEYLILFLSVVTGLPESTYLSAVKRFPGAAEPSLSNEIHVSELESSHHRCADVKQVWTPCQCHLELCIGWYPCGLKYCKGKGETKSSAMTYRCGIKTCRKCHLFSYYVAQKQQCLWDE